MPINSQIIRQKIDLNLQGKISDEELGKWAKETSRYIFLECHLLDIHIAPYKTILDKLYEFGQGCRRDAKEDLIHISRVLYGLCNETYCLSFTIPSESLGESKAFKKYLDLRTNTSKVEELNDLLTGILSGELLSENHISFFNEFATSSIVPIKTVIDLLFMQMVTIVKSYSYYDYLRPDSFHLYFHHADDDENVLSKNLLYEKLKRTACAYLGIEHFNIFSSFTNGIPNVYIVV